MFLKYFAIFAGWTHLTDRRADELSKYYDYSQDVAVVSTSSIHRQISSRSIWHLHFLLSYLSLFQDWRRYLMPYTWLSMPIIRRVIEKIYAAKVSRLKRYCDTPSPSSVRTALEHVDVFQPPEKAKSRDLR